MSIPVTFPYEQVSVGTWGDVWNVPFASTTYPLLAHHFPPLRTDGFQFLSSCYWTWFSKGVFLLRISFSSAMEDLKSGFDTLTEPHPEELVEGGVSLALPKYVWYWADSLCNVQ